MTTVALPEAPDASRHTAPWSPEDLLVQARSAAAGVEPWQGARAPSTRTYKLLERTSRYELWVIYWPEGGGLVLHDHGGSSGAFYVAGGTLEETSTTVARPRLRRRSVSAGQGRSFGPDYVHSVVNLGRRTATSVHAYSPPLSSMTFYSRSANGLVVARVLTEWEGAPPD